MTTETLYKSREQNRFKRGVELPFKLQQSPCKEKDSPFSPCRNQRIAVVHDWLPVYGGAERVLEQILLLFPHADLFTTMISLKESERAFLQGKVPHTSFIQRLPFSASAYRNYFPLMPLAVEQFDLSAYDIIISSSYAFAKGVLTGPDQLHLCYCHSPIRYAWDLQHQYLANCRQCSSALARIFLHYIRMWDTRTANGVNAFVSNSRFIARRIKKVYGRESRTIYPPVDVEQFAPCAEKEDYYVTAARFVPYKRMDLLVEAFARMPDKKLVVIGNGPEFLRVKQRATPNVSLLGHQSQAQLHQLLRKARAFVFAAEEDFGIALVEAQACGTPVIAFGRGGASETVIHKETGILFPDQSAESLIRAVKKFEQCDFHMKTIRKNAERYSIGNFRNNFADAVETEYTQLLGCI